MDGLRALCAVAEHGTFTRAAVALAVDKSKVSRDVSDLEERVGATLVLRTTRTVRLSSEGQALYERAQPALGVLADAVSLVRERTELPTGEVVVTTTPDLARVVLTPLLVQFRARYPGISLRLLLSSTLVDLARERADLALRVGSPGSSGHVARKLGELHSRFFAAPSYLRRRGVPTRVEHLDQHDGLWPRPPRGQKSFAFAGAMTRPVIESDDFELLRQLALAGGGVAMLPEFLAAGDVATGALQPVLDGLRLGAAPLFLVSQTPAKLSARVVSLRNHLLASLPRALGSSG